MGAMALHRQVYHDANWYRTGNSPTKDLDLEADEIDEVVMVGGTTRMPQIRELVRKELGVESLNTSVDAEHWQIPCILCGTNSKSRLLGVSESRANLHRHQGHHP